MNIKSVRIRMLSEHEFTTSSVVRNRGELCILEHDRLWKSTVIPRFFAIELYDVRFKRMVFGIVVFINNNGIE